MKARSGIASGSGWSLVNTLASMLPSFVGFVIVTNRLGADKLGLLALVTAALFPLRFADFGLSGAVTRYVGAYRGALPLGYSRQVVGTAWSVSLAAFVVLVGVCAVVSPPLLQRTIAASLNAEARALVPLIVAATLAQLVVGPVQASLLGLQRFGLVYKAGTACALVQLAAIVPLVRHFGVGGMVLSQLVLQLGLAAVFVPAFLLGKRGDGAADPDGARLDRKGFLGFAVQFSGNSLLAMLIDPLTKLVIGAVAPLSVMGVFEVLYRILSQLRSLLVSPFHPQGVALIASWQEGPSAVNRSYRAMTLLALLGALAILVAAPCVLAAYHVVTVQTPPIAVTGALAGAISLALASAFLTVPGYFLCIAASDLKPVMASTVANIGVQLVLGPLAGMAWGWRGSLGVFVLAHAASTAMQMVLVRRLLHYPAIPPLAELRAGMAELAAPLAAWARGERGG